MRETWVQSLGWEDPLEKGKATHYSGLENYMDYIVHGVTKSWTQLSNFHFHFSLRRRRDLEVSCSQCMRRGKAMRTQQGAGHLQTKGGHLTKN